MNPNVMLGLAFKELKMFANHLISLTHGFSERLRIAAEMLMIGVAFQETGNQWRVISIEGDDLGFLSTFVVSETACMLKRQGLKSNAAPEFFRGMNQQYVTFAHDPQLSSVPDEVIGEMVARRFRNPVTLM